MKMADLVKISINGMKVMSENGIKMHDWKFVEMFDEYCKMRLNKEKFRYIIAYLAEKFKVSESTVKRVVKRMAAEAEF